MPDQINAMLRGKKFKQLVDRLCEQIRAKYDLKQIEVDVLFYLTQNPDASASRTHRTLNLNKGQVSQALDSLCKKGYLSAHTDPHDRRCIYYECTPACQPFAAEMYELGRVMRRELFLGVTPEELAMLRQIWQKINANIDRLLAGQ